MTWSDQVERSVNDLPAPMAAEFVFSSIPGEMQARQAEAKVASRREGGGGLQPGGALGLTSLATRNRKRLQSIFWTKAKPKTHPPLFLNPPHVWNGCKMYHRSPSLSALSS